MFPRWADMAVKVLLLPLAVVLAVRDWLGRVLRS